MLLSEYGLTRRDKPDIVQLEYQERGDKAMLTNPEQFANVEAGLKAMGVIETFEAENGAILGRMMITTTDIPESIPVKREDRDNLVAFEASFDFCNVALGVVADPVRKTLESSVWGRYQTPGAERPSEEWVKFFLTTLFEHIASDGSYGIPMYSFVNNTSDFTAVPSAPVPDAAELVQMDEQEEPVE